MDDLRHERLHAAAVPLPIVCWITEGEVEEKIVVGLRECDEFLIPEEIFLRPYAVDEIHPTSVAALERIDNL